jgi:hypothetical protein
MPEAKNARPEQLFDDRFVRQLNSGRKPLRTSLLLTRRTRNLRCRFDLVVGGGFLRDT